MNNHQQIAILDFGSQYTHLIARRFRQLGILAKLYPTDFDVSQIPNLIGVVLSGSPGSVNNQSYPYNPKMFDLGVSILGLCYGHQLMAKHFGGSVKRGEFSEYGKSTLQVGQSKLFEGLSGGEVVWMSHGDSVAELPQDFKTIGATMECPIAAMENVAKKFYGLQFHPEVTHTPNGMVILKNFAFNICKARKDWDIKDWQAGIIKEIQDQAKGKKVFLLVSGGVDSTVCFALLEKALGSDRVYGLHIDTGFMRQGEVEQVQGTLAQAGFKNLHVYDASKIFLSKTVGIVNPEEKRKIIGQLFIDVKDRASSELGLNPDEWLLAQGTIYPDTIESGGTKNADTIKTHHNRVDKIQQLILEGKIIEPIKDLYKDEVRALGELLGLSEKLVWRQPFPGPGLAIRVLCHSSQEHLAVSEEAKDKLEKFFQTEKNLENFDEETSIAILPVRSVGVQGDERSYAHPAVLEFPISKSQFPKKIQIPNSNPQHPASRIQKFDWVKIEQISPKITNAVKAVNRVLIRVDSCSGGFQIHQGQLIEAALTKERLDLLREIDAIVNEEVFKAKLERDIWQFPVVLIPFGIDQKESIVLRPVSSLEAMTASFYPLDHEVLDKIVSRIEKLNKISFIFFDATNKPPATIEWE